jgi:hypothetical protein
VTAFGSGTSDEKGRKHSQAHCLHWRCLLLGALLRTRSKLLVILAVGVVVLASVAFIAAWAGSRAYLQHQVRLLLEDLKSLDTSRDPTDLSHMLMKKYANHFVGRNCIADYCANSFLFTNRTLSIFRLAPSAEIRVMFEQEANSLRDVHIEYTSAVFKENSPIVAISENFCPNRAIGECDYFALNPHGRNVSETWNGDVGFTQRVKPEIRRAGLGLNLRCFTAFRGCRDVSELLPTLWKVTAPATVSSRVRSDSDSIAEAAQPLPD